MVFCGAVALAFVRVCGLGWFSSASWWFCGGFVWFAYGMVVWVGLRDCAGLRWFLGWGLFDEFGGCGGFTMVGWF